VRADLDYHIPMASDTVADRLSASAAVASLRQEQHIADLLQHAGWQVTHGYYYRDPATDKYRELDVVARHYWSKRGLRRRNHSVIVEVLCEIKSIRDFHIVFAPNVADDRYHTTIYAEWFGYHEKRLAATLDEAGASADVIARMLKYFRRTCYSRGSEAGRAARMFICPPDADFRASAFRETNIGSEKDLDSSVFWRATQAVFSAINSTRASFLNHRFEEIADSIAYAQHAKLDIALSMVETDIDMGAEHVQVIHPVVVVDARMWASEGEELKEVESCRFLRRGREYEAAWCDIVTRSSADRYFTELTEYYEREARKRRAY
jgi:hypothetical protein